MSDQDYRDAIGSFVEQSVRLAEAEKERDELRATVRRVEALADEWAARKPSVAIAFGGATRLLRATLSDRQEDA